jgi:hypothetical protein
VRTKTINTLTAYYTTMTLLSVIFINWEILTREDNISNSLIVHSKNFLENFEINIGYASVT